VNFHVRISDSFQCSTIFPLSLVLHLPDLVPPSEVGNSCNSFQKLGKHLEFLQCTDNQVIAQQSASAARGSKRRLLADDGVALKTSAIQKIAVSANEAPLDVTSLARSYVQSITPLCSGGDLAGETSSVHSIYWINLPKRCCNSRTAALLPRA
jgi:hypothetical protein